MKLLAFALVTLAATAPAASAATPFASSPRPANVAAHGLTTLWDAYDPAAGTYRLMQRAAGVVAPVAVAPSRLPFEASAGSGPGGFTNAVFVRCAGDRCAVRRFDLQAGVERPVPGATGRRADVLAAAIDGRTVVFTRGRTLYAVGVTGGTPRRLYTAPRGELDEVEARDGKVALVRSEELADERVVREVLVLDRRSRAVRSVFCRAGEPDAGVFGVAFDEGARRLTWATAGAGGPSRFHERALRSGRTRQATAPDGLVDAEFTAAHRGFLVELAGEDAHTLALTGPVDWR